MRKPLNGLSIFAVLVILSGSLQSAGAQQVGTTGAVNPAAQSAPPGSGQRTMNVGANVVYKERINTSGSGSVQLVFVDRTTLSIGPNSQVTIDEFVYDPKSETGRMTASLTKGVMRFVGGQASHTGGATIKTPATTLGVRGGVVTVRHDVQTGTRAINHFGIMTAQTPSGQEIIRRPGFALNVASSQTAPSAPVRAPQSEIDANNRQLTSVGGQTGGRRETPTDEGASKAVGQANRPVTVTNSDGQKQTTAQVVNLIRQQPLDALSARNVIQTIAQTGSQQEVISTLPTLNSKPVAQRRVYAMQGYEISGELVPSGFVSPGPWFESPIYGYGAGGTDGDGVTNTGSRIMMAGLVINGQGASQTSTIYGLWAGVYESNGEFIVDGGLRGTTRLNSASPMGRLSSSIASQPGSVSVDSAYSPLSATVDQFTYDTAGNRVSQTGFAYNGLGTSGNYGFVGQVSRIPAPTALGSPRPVVDLLGISTGLMRTSSNSLNQFVGPSFPVWGDTIIKLTDAGRFSAAMDVFRMAQPAGPADNFYSGSYLFGYQGEGTGGRSTYVDYENFLAGESGVRGTGQRLSTTNGQAVVNQHSLLVTNSTVGARNFFPGVNFCNCAFSRWGFWSSDTQRPGQTATGGPDVVRDRVHLGTWVAGIPTPAVDVPATGTASFAGHIIGSFKSGANEYVAAGNFNSAVDFGTNSGTFAVTALDGRNYGGSLNIDTANRTFFYGGGNTVAGPTASMYIDGAFMQGAAGPAGEKVGAFIVNGSNYVGTGSFMATR